MPKDKKLIIANWKMNPEKSKDAIRIFSTIKKSTGKMLNVQTVVCPPFVFLSGLKKKVSGHRCVIGSQDVFYMEGGSFTGEISPTQLKDFGVKYVIVGHSERRVLGESNSDVSKKIGLCIKHMITPVVCVGEVARDESGSHFHFIKEQIVSSLEGVPKSALTRIVIAYEPVWAIGKNAVRSATPEEAEEMIIFIKKVMSEHYQLKSYPGTQILFGGSVDVVNAKSFLEKKVIDGLLVGRASLDPKEFSAILKIANSL